MENEKKVQFRNYHNISAPLLWHCKEYCMFDEISLGTKAFGTIFIFTSKWKQMQCLENMLSSFI